MGFYFLQLTAKLNKQVRFCSVNSIYFVYSGVYLFEKFEWEVNYLKKLVKKTQKKATKIVRATIIENNKVGSGISKFSKYSVF